MQFNLWAVMESSNSSPKSLDPITLEGIVIDDLQATTIGKWGSHSRICGEWISP